VDDLIVYIMESGMQRTDALGSLSLGYSCFFLYAGSAPFGKDEATNKTPTHMLDDEHAFHLEVNVDQLSLQYSPYEAHVVFPMVVGCRGTTC
jgi:hypothetical protein